MCNAIKKYFMQQWSGTPDSSSLLVHYVYSFFFSAQVQEETERVGGCDPPVALIQSLFLQEVLGLGPNTKHQAEKLSIFTRQRSAALHSSLLVYQQSVCGCIYNPVSPV